MVLFGNSRSTTLVFWTSLLLLVATTTTTEAHFFWVNVDKEAGQVEVTFSEDAGVPSTVIQKISDKLYDSQVFMLSVMQFGGNSHPEAGGKRPFVRERIDWTLEDDRIVGTFSEAVRAKLNEVSTVVTGRLDFGAFQEGPIDVDDLQESFKSDQLVMRRDAKKVAGHQQMRVKPFYMALKGCGAEIQASVHGLSHHTDADPINVCFYQLGGKELGCVDAVPESDDDDFASAILKVGADLLIQDVTIFAKTHAQFGTEEGQKGTAKFDTVTADYKANCVGSTW